jgi:trigger factor
LLCDKHHREKTAGLLPPTEVKAANAAPHNLRNGVSKPYDLHFNGDAAEIHIGGNRFTCKNAGYGTAMAPLLVDGIALVGAVIGDDHLLLNLAVFDEFNNEILHIKNNQLLYKPDPWDIQLVGTTLTVREAQRKILIEIEFRPPNRLDIVRGRFLCNGVEILVRPEHILVTNNNTFISGCSCINSFGGLIIGRRSTSASGFMLIADVPRYFGDRQETIRFEKETIEKVRTLGNV